MRIASVIYVAIGVAILAGCESANTQALEPATIPPSTQIVEPSASVPAEYAAFSGVWSGKWDGWLDSKLAVHTIQPDGKVAVIYAWGDHRDGRFDAGSVPTVGRINDGVLELEPFGNGAVATFTLTEDGTLDATYDLNGDVSHAEFVKS